MIFHFVKNFFRLKNDVVNLLSIDTEVENDVFEVIFRGTSVFDGKGSILVKKTWLRHVLTFKGLVQNGDDFKVFIIISFVRIFG
jgi:hypothetical protein